MLMILHDPLDIGGKGLCLLAVGMQKPTGRKAVRVNTIGTFIDRADAGIAISLFQAIFPQIAVAAQNLHRRLRNIHSRFGPSNLGHWGHEISQRLLVGFDSDQRCMRQSTRCDGLAVHLVKHPTHIGVLRQAHGLAIRPAPLDAPLRIRRRNCLRARRMCHALKRNIQTGMVH